MRFCTKGFGSSTFSKISSLPFAIKLRTFYVDIFNIINFRHSKFSLENFVLCLIKWIREINFFVSEKLQFRSLTVIIRQCSLSHCHFNLSSIFLNQISTEKMVWYKDIQIRVLFLYVYKISIKWITLLLVIYFRVCVRICISV